MAQNGPAATLHISTTFTPESGCVKSVMSRTGTSYVPLKNDNILAAGS
jgi:hypothetical protein